MYEMENFEHLLIEYGQMPGTDVLKELYNLNIIKGKEKKEKKMAWPITAAQMWSWV